MPPYARATLDQPVDRRWGGVAGGGLKRRRRRHVGKEHCSGLDAILVVRM
jgi:hypothetical protein